ncbi:hypothetical protein AQUCO_06300011v1 [Aquilegia coerulea]|uniref:PGG domain-containing protein n=1 Tax=Aquilegia coerulea TaxID=218851 RepID=A0A2G5CCQ4_AQUCA|nr:hypothetical protein AQUCO_06300011v1 [Aquilegia coerulea]
MSPLDHVKQGDMDYFKRVELDVLWNFRSETGNGILAEAAHEGQLDCCKEIYKRCPEQLFSQNMKGNTILHHVSKHRGRVSFTMLAFFLDTGAKVEEDIKNGWREDKLNFNEWCKLQNHKGETALYRSFKVRNLKTAKLWIKIDSDHGLQLLRVTNNEGNTPLHLAVGRQDLELVKLLTVEEPDFDYGVNRNRETPIMIAVREAEWRQMYGDGTSVKIRKLLLKTQPRQSKVRAWDQKWTILHFAAGTGYLDAVKDIIHFCPDCMEVVDIQGHNFLHVAAMYQQKHVVDYISKSEVISDEVLNGLNVHGNTPLHIAALSGNVSMTQCLLDNNRVDRMTTNANGQKVLDAITFDHDKTIAGVRGEGINGRMSEKKLLDQANIGLVVGTLIGTMSLIAAIIVPAGYSTGEEPNLGFASFSRSTSFEAFMISNYFALLFSLYAVFSNLSTTFLYERQDIINKLNVASICSLGAMFAMMVAFMTWSYAVLTISKRTAIALLLLVFTFSCYILYG